jgi:hypothetical protein
VVLAASQRAELAASLIDLVGRTATGSTVVVPVIDREGADLVLRWCQATGNSVYAVHEDSVEVYRGAFPDEAVGMSAERRPGYRLWLYTNFHCNLACDYCCVESSPKAEPRILSAAAIAQLVDEGIAAGTREIYLTGGEPFLHPDLLEVVDVCSAAAPTVLLTNAMLFRGARLDALKAMSRDGLTLQISLDSATPDVHDQHRALDGVRTAKALGFRVRLAVTSANDAPRDTEAFAKLCGDLGLTAADVIVRSVARQGSATSGILISRATVVPEVCVTASGVYWHPVAALDPAMRVTERIHPLADAVHEITTEFLAYRRNGDVLAATFPCA